MKPVLKEDFLTMAVRIDEPTNEPANKAMAIFVKTAILTAPLNEF